MYRSSLRMVVAAVALALLPSCTKKDGATGPRSASAASDDSDSEEQVVIEKLPDGRTRKTTIRKTKTAPKPPPPRPADPYPGDPLVRYNVERINEYRSGKGLAPVLYDAKISAFAREGSQQLSRDHAPHGHFRARMNGSSMPPGFGTKSAENQGDPRGVREMDPDAAKNGRAQIDVMLKMMMDEGPGGGHHDNMMNPDFRRVGIGLVYAGGKLYLTNDFSD